MAVRDVTGDGRADIVLGSGQKLRVLAGVTGAQVMDELPFAPKFTGGVQVAVGEVNGDGMGDIIAGPGPAAARGSSIQQLLRCGRNSRLAPRAIGEACRWPPPIWMVMAARI